MKPLETNRQVLMWLCGFSPDESVVKWKKIACNAFTSSVIIIHLLSVLAGGTFILKNKSNGLEEILYSLMHTLGSSNMLYESIVTVFLCRELSEIFEELTNIYNESKWTICIVC